jgi:hypothetical protein
VIKRAWIFALRLSPLFLLVLLVASGSPAAAQIKGTARILTVEREPIIDLMKKGAIRVFLDCDSCDVNYITKEIPFVNFVRDRAEADVHILITTQGTGSGGQEQTISFIGLGTYANLSDTLTCVSLPIDTADEVRRGLVRVLKLGLVPFVYKTPIAGKITVGFTEEVKPTAVEDKWNSWVFNVGVNGSVNGEKSYHSTTLNGSLSANRVTPGSKLRLGASGNFDLSEFDVGDGTISSYSDSKDARGLYVKSLSEHWALGGWTSISSRTFSNTALAFNLAPAIEYSIFPYSESTRRLVLILYRLGYNFWRYREETIYEKTEEGLWSEALSATVEIKEPWGTAGATLEGSHYFHDLSKYRIELYGNVNISLFGGFMISLMGGFSTIHDQLSLPRGGASLDEILLRRRELATDYSFFASIGLGFTFGSVFSNVVNPRFGR